MRLNILLPASCFCLLILAGCGVTQPARYYILTPVEDSGPQATSGPALGIGPVGFPAYLDRPEIAHRSGSNELHFADSDRWAEPLKTTFSRTLAEDLSVMFPTNRVSLFPWARSTRIDYQISIDVLRFDADASGTVMLTATWEISRPEEVADASHYRQTYTEAAGSLAYPAVVAAQSRAVGRLARDIVRAIRAQPADRALSRQPE